MSEADKRTFQGKSSLIYGGGNGIGRASALEFAKRGALVVIADLDLDGARETADRIMSAGGKASAVRCDVLSETSVREAAVAAETAFGPADIVMNTVGAILHGNPEDIPLAEWQRILDLNLMSVVRSNAVFMPRMIARGSGYIVTTASFAGLYPFATSRMPYVAAKAAVVALTQSLALYLRPLGITVSCLCPGPTITTVADGMKVWTANLGNRGPGSKLAINTPEKAAVLLAEGMQAGRVFIPTHPEALGTVQELWADPDAFIERKLAEYAAGDIGMPSMAPGDAAG